MKSLLLVFLLLCVAKTSAQITIQAKAYFNPDNHTISVDQTIVYANESSDTLSVIYLNDWANSFRYKASPLGKHFASQYNKKFHFSKQEERGWTRIDLVENRYANRLTWSRSKAHPDLLKITLANPVEPRSIRQIHLNYTVRIPMDKFTGYGRDAEGTYNLRYWLLTPAVYDEQWQLYSNQDLGDQFQPLCHLTVVLNVPTVYSVQSNLNKKTLSRNVAYKNIQLSGEQRNSQQLFISKYQPFDRFEAEHVELRSNLDDEGMLSANKSATVKRIMGFLKKRLGAYPHSKLLITKADYKSSPVYGLNQLPSFVRPFPDGFQYDLKMMKTITRAYLKNTLQLNPREDYWVWQAIEINLLMDYVETYYPNTKLIGKLSELIGVRWTHLAELKFNYRYHFFYRNIDRINLAQPLAMRKDSLVKYNEEIGNPFKAGIGLAYLGAFLESDGVIQKAIREFYQQYNLKPVEAQDFKGVLEKYATKNIDWFFTQYVKRNSRLDFTIDNVEVLGDSLRVSIRNKEPNTMPVSLYALHDDEIIAKYWVTDTDSLTTIVIPKDSVMRLGLNVEGVIPEINKRNNYKNLKGIFNKPLKFRLFKDIENPERTQFFFMPQFSYNLYDGLALGVQLSNSAVLPKRFDYQITPQYAFGSQALVGSVSVSNTHQFRNKNLSAFTYGVAANRHSYARDLFYYRFSPYVIFKFRHRDLRNTERQYITLRGVSVYREEGNHQQLIEKPNYNVFDVQYTYNAPGMTDSFGATIDAQFADKFGKASLTAKWKKMFLNNRQIEVRLFAGAFLYNHADSDYFSFALDRPTDYMFDYNYYGRSESSGLFSQQYIESEGGFKSKLKPAFADQWITTLNASVSVWRDLAFVYGDLGLVKNAGVAPEFVYDSGVRISLVQDYFELYFPMYSNLGWEISQPHYIEKIRFIVSLDFDTLFGLFERSYY